MKIKQLIEILSTYPEDADVFVYDEFRDSLEFAPVSGVRNDNQHVVIHW